MKILDMLKNSKIGVFFRFLRGQKALAEKNEILEQEDVIAEKSEHKKFVERINNDANDISRMTKADAMIHILKELGLKEDILKNQEAIKQIELLTNIYYNRHDKMNDEIGEKLKTDLSKIVKDGIIEKVEEEISTENSINRKTITIDVDEYGRLDMGEISEYKQNLEIFKDMLHNGKSENEALKESGYESKKVEKHTISDYGVEFEKSYYTIENLDSISNAKITRIEFIRNEDLVTATVRATNVLTNESYSINDRWANPAEGRNQAHLMGIEEGHIVTDIDKIAEISNKDYNFDHVSDLTEEEKKLLIADAKESWCGGNLALLTEEKKKEFIESKKEAIKSNSYFKKLFEKREKTSETNREDIDD